MVKALRRSSRLAKCKPTIEKENRPPVKVGQSKRLTRSYETTKLNLGYQKIVGVDEAGRGPLAGPVVAAACFVPMDVYIEGVQDSKTLSEEQRELLFKKLTSHPKVEYSVHVNDRERIDEINILQATLESMQETVRLFPSKVDFVFIDGNRAPSLEVNMQTVIKGDTKVYCIAAASIIAKVTRDRMMLQYHQTYPQYGFDMHKGYGVKSHMAAIHKHGPSPIHRTTFAPVKHMIGK